MPTGQGTHVRVGDVQGECLGKMHPPLDEQASHVVHDVPAHAVAHMNQQQLLQFCAWYCAVMLEYVQPAGAI